MAQSSKVNRQRATSFVLTVVAAGAVPLFIDMPSRAATTASGIRSIFLNGTDISSARSQDLKNVDIRINENGDIFIVAPHYQVSEEDTYVPLSKFVEGLNGPKHKAPQGVPNEVTSPKAVPSTEASEAIPVTRPAKTANAADAGGLVPKAGSPVSAPAAAEGEPVVEPAADQPPELPDDAVSESK